MFKIFVYSIAVKACFRMFLQISDVFYYYPSQSLSRCSSSTSVIHFIKHQWIFSLLLEPSSKATTEQPLSTGLPPFGGCGWYNYFMNTELNE